MSPKNSVKKITCMACGMIISSLKDAKTHPRLGTLECARCVATYGDGDFSRIDSGVDENGDDNYCRWCTDGGSLFLCATNGCHNGFCDNCIVRNLGQSKYDEISTNEDWSCFICRPLQLELLVEETKQTIAQLMSKKRESTERASISSTKQKKSKKMTSMATSTPSRKAPKDSFRAPQADTSESVTSQQTKSNGKPRRDNSEPALAPSETKSNTKPPKDDSEPLAPTQSKANAKSQIEITEPVTPAQTKSNGRLQRDNPESMTPPENKTNPKPSESDTPAKTKANVRAQIADAEPLTPAQIKANAKAQSSNTGPPAPALVKSYAKQPLANFEPLTPQQIKANAKPHRVSHIPKDSIWPGKPSTSSSTLNRSLPNSKPKATDSSSKVTKPKATTSGTKGIQRVTLPKNNSPNGSAFDRNEIVVIDDTSPMTGLPSDLSTGPDPIPTKSHPAAEKIVDPKPKRIDLFQERLDSIQAMTKSLPKRPESTSKLQDVATDNSTKPKSANIKASFEQLKADLMKAPKQRVKPARPEPLDQTTTSKGPVSDTNVEKTPSKKAPVPPLMLRRTGQDDDLMKWSPVVKSNINANESSSQGISSIFLTESTPPKTIPQPNRPSPLIMDEPIQESPVQTGLPPRTEAAPIQPATPTQTAVPTQAATPKTRPAGIKSIFGNSKLFKSRATRNNCVSFQQPHQPAPNQSAELASVSLNNVGGEKSHGALNASSLDTNQDKIEAPNTKSLPSEVSDKSEADKQTNTTAPLPPSPEATSLTPVQTVENKKQNSARVTAITTNDETTTKSPTSDSANPLLGSELLKTTVKSDPPGDKSLGALNFSSLGTNQDKIDAETKKSLPSEVSEKSETEKQTSTTAPPPPPSSPPPATSLAPVQTDMDSKKQQESTSVTAITTNDETTTKSSTDNAKPLLGSELPGNTVRSGESDKKKVEETEKEVTKSKEEEKPVVESTTVAGVGKKDEDISDNSSELEGKLAPKSKPTVDTINKDSKPEPAVVTKQSESAGSSSFAPTSSSSTTSTTTTTTTTALSPSSSDDKIKILTAAIVPVIVSSIANGNKKIDSLAPSSKPIVPDTIAKESDNRSSSKPDQLEQTVNNNATSTTLGSSTKRPTTSSSSWPSWSQGTTGVGRRRPQVPSLLPLPPFRRRKPPTRPTFGDDSIDSTYSTTSTTTKTRASSGPSSTRKPYRPHSTSFNTPHASGFSPLDDDTPYSGLGGGHSGSRRHYHHRYHHHHHHHDKPARRNRPSYGTDNLRPSFYDNHHDSGYNVNEDRPTHAVGTREGAVSESNQGSSLGNTNVGGGFSSTERRRPGIGGLFGGGGGIGDMLNPFTSFLDRNPLGSVLSGGRGESHTHGGYDGDYGHRHRHGHHRPHNHRENHGHHGHHGGHGGGHGHNGGYDHGGYGGGHDSVYGGGYGGGHGGHGIGNEGYGGEYGDVYQPRPPPIVGGRPYGGDSYGDQFRPIGGEWSPFDSLFSTFDDMFSGGGSNRPFGYRKNITSTVINSTNNGPTSSSGGSSVNKDTIITTNDDDTTETSTTDIPRIPTMRRLTSSQRSRDSGSNQPVVVAKRQTSESSPIDKLKHLAPSSYLERSSSMEKDSQKESAVSISDIASKPTKSDEPSEPVIGNNETYKIPLESPSQNGPCNGPDVDLKRGLVCFFMHINKPVHQFNWFPLNLNKMFSIPNVPIQKSVLSV